MDISVCSCSLVLDTRRFSGTCDEACTPEPVTSDCSNFDPDIHSITGITATNAPGDEAVCLATSPLASHLFGRRTACMVDGEATIKVEDDTKTTDARGIVEFLGDPCPGQSCPVGMDYRLDIDPVTFSNFFGSATFSDLAGLGESLPGNDAVLSAGGIGAFAPNTTETSARGERRRSGRAGDRERRCPRVGVRGTFAPACSVHQGDCGRP
jgi:hypothetical protein